MEAQLLEQECSVIQPENPALKILQAWCDLNFGRHEERTFMVCPFCSHQIAPLWQKVFLLSDEHGNALGTPTDTISSELPKRLATSGAYQTIRVLVKLTWARCPNEDCHQVLVQVVRTIYNHSIASAEESASWYAVPKIKPIPTLDERVTGHYRSNYREACRIMDDSPRMSTVLSRRILSDLLEQYAGLNDYKLSNRIDAFIANNSYPSRIKDNLHYLREMGDFSAHTQRDDQGIVIDASRAEAEWTLKVVGDLFDFFIIEPEKDRVMRAAFDKKLDQAGRKPIKKTP